MPLKQWTGRTRQESSHLQHGLRKVVCSCDDLCMKKSGLVLMEKVRIRWCSLLEEETS